MYNLISVNYFSDYGILHAEIQTQSSVKFKGSDWLAEAKLDDFHECILFEIILKFANLSGSEKVGYNLDICFVGV